MRVRPPPPAPNTAKPAKAGFSIWCSQGGRTGFGRRRAGGRARLEGARKPGAAPRRPMAKPPRLMRATPSSSTIYFREAMTSGRYRFFDISASSLNRSEKHYHTSDRFEVGRSPRPSAQVSSNGVKPHSALGNRSPAPETIAFPGMRLPNSWSFLETSGGLLH